jgi:hypothetical protein
MKQIAVIGSTALRNYIFKHEIKEKKFLVKKLFVGNNRNAPLEESMANIEIVESLQQIIDDGSLEMVIVSHEELQHAGAVVRAGIKVRIV